MCTKYWWSDSWTFLPWKCCPSRPDPVEVLLFYLNKRGVQSEEHIPYLMDLLHLQKSMVYNILKGVGLDSIFRCRELVQVLKIPPPLLGIDAKYYPIDLHACWWKACGFPFNADEQGYPVMSEVVAYLRKKRIKIDRDGKPDRWSQEDLGEACDLKKETIYRIEHDKHPYVLESMHRRAVIATALGRYEGVDEATIFCLFGLAPQAYRVQISAHESRPVVHFSAYNLTDEILSEYKKQQQAFFMEYYTCHAQDAVSDIHEWARQFEADLVLASTTGQRISLLAFASRSHRLLACIAREQCEKERILFHSQKAVELAEQAGTLLNAKMNDNRIHRGLASELLASALCTQALAAYELEEYDMAEVTIDHALGLLPGVASRQLKTEILGAVALIHALDATTATDCTLVLSFLERAASLHTANPAPKEVPDENFFWCGRDVVALYKAKVFMLPNMRGSTAEKVSDILEAAQRWTPTELIRRRTCIEYLQAQLHLLEGEYESATHAALFVLEQSREIRSRLLRNTVEDLYQQLLHTSFSDKPLLACLGMKLRMWDHGIG